MSLDPEAVLFDIDGTLIDSNELHVAAWREAFGDFGYALDPDRIRAEIGKGGDKLVPALLPRATDQINSVIAARHGAIFTTHYLSRAQPFAAAGDLLRRVSRTGRKVVLASSATTAEVNHYIGLLCIADVVDAMTSIDDVGQSKPAPDIFETALRKVDVSPERAMVVGDTIWDAQAASRSGLRAIGLLSGGRDKNQLRSAGAIATYCDVSDLLMNFALSPLNN